ncbi:MAG: CoA transferase [Ilumatobacteraceae bacterium]
MATNGPRPLTGVRVVDTADERGALCARILADLGADVVKVERPGGAPSRTLPPLAPDGQSLSFALRNVNKRSTTIDLATDDGRARFDRLLAGADIWVDGHRPTELEALGLDLDQVARRHPRLVVTAISDFGRTGPYRDFVATDDVMVAMGGMLARSGVVGRPPLLPPGSLAYDVSSTSAAFFTLAALWQRARTGSGQVLDVSVMQAIAQITDWSMPNYSQIEGTGGIYGQVRSGSGPVYPLYPCADGYVRLIVLSPRQWHAIRAWLGEPEELQDEHWDSLLARMSIQADLLDPLYVELFADYTAAELADEAQRRGVVMTPVLKPAEVPSIAHFVERGTFGDLEAAEGVVGRLATGFFELDGERAGYVHRSPSPGEHGDVDAEWDAVAPASTGSSAGRSHPFEGLKVLDLGHGGVGVETGRLFAEYGADVIKVETHTYPDFIRQVSGGMMSPSFASSSRSKRSLGVNAKTEGGLEVLKRLAAWADVLIENTSTGTMDDMGIPWDVLHDANPRLVMASSQLMGSRGPWKDWLGYGPSTRPAGGMTYLWNFDDGGMPPGSGAIHPDHLVGRMLAVGALAALLGRERQGLDGVHVEVAQVETLINILGDLFLKESLVPGSVGPLGNRSERGAPWGVYPCAGDERWCVITIRHDDDWRALCATLGEPDWAMAPGLDSVDGRRAAHDELDEQLAAWTAQRSDREVMATLQAAGVPAGIMCYPSDLAEDEHSVARRFPVPIVQPPIGQLLLEGALFESTGMPEPHVAPAPMLGEHTREICRDLLGMSDAEIDELVAAGALEEAAG